ncbi:acyltransferase [Arthrobacter sp. zg-ZUI100]|uniref:acyltransferase family protein n=1 Tax=Arthrobacter jiangjiafuii TaxID=2817475 RepID=UPI001AEE336D|nr:acyltransferase [Arthrobacter jiangjiafuii]MBP3037152.1 acyltransferase [Arthrobacter jiangjiafuii]
MTDYPTKRLDLKFLDGLRAVSAVAVVVFHAYLFTGRTGEAESNLPTLFKLINLGNFAVPMFIVLSGFVLMLPVAGSSDLRLKGGLINYIKRRARRILPPYYASLILFGTLILLLPILSTRRDTAWDSKIPVTWTGATSHLFLVHNLNLEWIYQINGPAWSVATEWQIYFVFPLLLLPVWRKFGGGGMIFISLAIPFALVMLFPAVGGAHLWFIALFAMGAIAAHAVVLNKPVPHLGIVTFVSWIVAGAVVGIGVFPVALNELILGAAMALFVMWLARCHQEGRRTLFHAVLESKVLVWVGLWSYSLYLVHSPVLALGNLLFLEVDMSTLARFGIQLLITVPVAGLVAFAFHCVIERRFMTSHQEAAEPAQR